MFGGEFISKGIKGSDIYKVKRLSDNVVAVILNNGDQIVFEAKMCDYEECKLVSYFQGSNE